MLLAAARSPLPRAPCTAEPQTPFFNTARARVVPISRLGSWVLLALALGRRAVLPYTPCMLGAGGMPMGTWEEVINLGNRSLCEGGAATDPRWRGPAEAAVGFSSDWSAAIEFGGRGGGGAAAAGGGGGGGGGSGGGITPSLQSCCVWVPPSGCIDTVGTRPAGLRGELVLTETDFSRLLDERSEAARSSPEASRSFHRQRRPLHERGEAHARAGGVGASGADAGGADVSAADVRIASLADVLAHRRRAQPAHRTNATLSALRTLGRRARVLVLDASDSRGGSLPLRRLGTLSELYMAAAAPAVAARFLRQGVEPGYAAQCASSLHRVRVLPAGLEARRAAIRAGGTAAAALPAAAAWLGRSRDGYCARTDGAGDCAAGDKGSFPLARAASADYESAARACLDMCAQCAGCRYVSLSPQHADCSWFRACDLDRGLHSDVGGFISGARFAG